MAPATISLWHNYCGFPGRLINKFYFMAGRGDKNKKNTSRHESSNQPGQRYTNSADQKSERNKRTTGGSPSLGREKNSDVSADRNRNTHPEDLITPLHGSQRNFDLLVDSVPYLIQSAAFEFNGEIRWLVSVNGNEEHVFTWDAELKRVRAIDNGASIIPDSLEAAISEKLQSKA
jgi:hypothetical protein